MTLWGVGGSAPGGSLPGAGERGNLLGYARVSSHGIPMRTSDIEREGAPTDIKGELRLLLPISRRLLATSQPLSSLKGGGDGDLWPAALSHQRRWRSCASQYA